MADDENPNTGGDITTLEQLEALYPKPSVQAKNKKASLLSAELQAKAAASTLVVIASNGTDGLDCSPRGDAAGKLVYVLDARTLAIPDRRGSKRLDTARNIIANASVALWLLSADWEQSLRINGTARLSDELTLRKRCALEGELPVSVMVVSVTSAALHNDRAVRLSGFRPQLP